MIKNINKEFPKSSKIYLKNLKYLIPNSITALSMLFSFISIELSIRARIEKDLDLFAKSSYFIIFAGICDFLDGSLARLFHACSAFGAQFDSLTDIVAFGVTPSILIYNFALFQLNHFGVFLCFALILCGALRLARFNLQTAGGGFSIGIPITMPGIFFANLVLCSRDVMNLKTLNYPLISMMKDFFLFEDKLILMIAIYSVGLSIGMVTEFKYFSNKMLKLPENPNLKIFTMIAMVVSLIFIRINFNYGLFVIMNLYFIHGLVIWIISKI